MKIKRPKIKHKSLGSYFVKEGFTGTRKDKLGHDRCYNEGVPVPCHPDEQSPKDEIRGSGRQEIQRSGAGEAQPASHTTEQHHKAPKDLAPPPAGERLAHPDCADCLYDPDPHAINPEIGLAVHARVGVPAFHVPPPPNEIPRLPNLTEKERAAESRFADKYLEDPDEMVARYAKGRNQIVGHEVKPKNVAGFIQEATALGLKAKEGKDKDGKGNGKVKMSGDQGAMNKMLKAHDLKPNPSYAIGDAPHIFNMDDCKLLSPDYNPQGVSEQQNKDGRGLYNLSTHQTANAIAKRAFLKHLDEVVASLPEDRKRVLVTSGGCAAGKGFALVNIDETRDLMNSVGAVWDSAGEQNATENPWIMEECRKRGIKAVFAFIHADPVNTWTNPERGVVQRAGVVGRMVDARVFADSYALGAKNFKAFMDKEIEAPDAEFHVIDNSKGGKPQRSSQVPQEALAVDAEHLYGRATAEIESKADKLNPAVLRGGTIGQQVWGKARKGKAPAQAAPAPAKGLRGWKGKSQSDGDDAYEQANPPEPSSQEVPKEKWNAKDEKFSFWADSIINAMIKNLEHNDANRDSVDEWKFANSLQVEPFEIKGDEKHEPDKPPSIKDQMDALRLQPPRTQEQDDLEEDETAGPLAKDKKVGKSPFQGRGGKSLRFFTKDDSAGVIKEAPKPKKPKAQAAPSPAPAAPPKPPPQAPKPAAAVPSPKPTSPEPLSSQAATKPAPNQPKPSAPAAKSPTETVVSKKPEISQPKVRKIESSPYKDTSSSSGQQEKSRSNQSKVADANPKQAEYSEKFNSIALSEDGLDYGKIHDYFLDELGYENGLKNSDIYKYADKVEKAYEKAYNSLQGSEEQKEATARKAAANEFYKQVPLAKKHSDKILNSPEYKQRQEDFKKRQEDFLRVQEQSRSEWASQKKAEQEEQAAKELDEYRKATTPVFQVDFPVNDELDYPDWRLSHQKIVEMGGDEEDYKQFAKAFQDTKLFTVGSGKDKTEAAMNAAQKVFSQIRSGNKGVSSEIREKYKGGDSITRKFHASLSSYIDNQTTISPENKKLYKSEMDKAVSRIPEKAMLRYMENAQKFNFYDNALEVGEQAKRYIKEGMIWSGIFSGMNQAELEEHLRKAEDELNNRGGITLAYYAPAVKQLVLDGGNESPDNNDLFNNPHSEPAAVYSHEITHAIDGPNYEISSSIEWEDAFKTEILLDHSPLSEYAKTNSREGLAEFGRLAFHGSNDLAKVEKHFPKCTEVFKKHGLWPDTPAQGQKAFDFRPEEDKLTSPILPELFDLWIPFKNGGAGDGRTKAFQDKLNGIVKPPIPFHKYKVQKLREKHGKGLEVPPSPFAQTKGLTFSIKGGFSGQIRDRLGRHRCYENGHPVKCGKGGQPARNQVAQGRYQPNKPRIHPGTRHGAVLHVKPIPQRAWQGIPTPLSTQLTKQETGRLGEAIGVAFLRDVLGAADARQMNTAQANFPVDVIEDHSPTEVKAGLASNSPSAMQWRLTFSQESETEKQMYAQMDADELALWNMQKQKRIHQRKNAVIKALKKDNPGIKITPRTLTMIINPDTQTADVYLFDGFRDRIGWTSEEAKEAYQGSYYYYQEVR